MSGDSPSRLDCTPVPGVSPSRRGRKGMAMALNGRSRRSLRKRLRQTKDARLAKRCQILLQRAQGCTYRDIAQSVGVSINTVYEVLKRFLDLGETGLIDRREDNGQVKADDAFLRSLWQILEHPAPHYGWPRPSWTIAMLVDTAARQTGVRVSRSTLSRALAAIGARQGRPKPIVLSPWSKARRTRRLNLIGRLLQNLGRRQVAVWADEVDVHLNPKIGPDWMLPGRQRRVLTPGQNQKRYIAGALNAKTRRVTWVTGDRKNSGLFIRLLTKLIEEYPGATVIHVMLDNFKIHSSKQTLSFLAQLGKRIQLHFLPPYSPDDNPIERFWRDFHDNVTKNHRYRKMAWLMKAADGYLRWRNDELSATPTRQIA